LGEFLLGEFCEFVILPNFKDFKKNERKNKPRKVASHSIHKAKCGKKKGEKAQKGEKCLYFCRKNKFFVKFFVPKPQNRQPKHERINEKKPVKPDINKPRQKDEKNMPRKAREMKDYARKFVRKPLQSSDKIKAKREIQHQNADKIVDKG